MPAPWHRAAPESHTHAFQGCAVARPPETAPPEPARPPAGPSSRHGRPVSGWPLSDRPGRRRTPGRDGAPAGNSPAPWRDPPASGTSTPGRSRRAPSGAAGRHPKSRMGCDHSEGGAVQRGRGCPTALSRNSRGVGKRRMWATPARPRTRQPSTPVPPRSGCDRRRPYSVRTPWSATAIARARRWRHPGDPGSSDPSDLARFPTNRCQGSLRHSP